ncbi:MAG: hypothetical protein AAF280_11340 [Pseudomonadota bacterium]
MPRQYKRDSSKHKRPHGRNSLVGGDPGRFAQGTGSIKLPKILGRVRLLMGRVNAGVVDSGGRLMHSAAIETVTTGGPELNMRIIRRLQHGPRFALQIRLQG